ncbi:MAG: tetratricopeptide repeat protein [Actinomycetota bacterium]
MLLGAAEASIDVAGAALLPGAWPILKRALEPVLQRLKERLGGADITENRARAEQAVAEFEADGHLQEVFRSTLLEQLDSLVASGQTIEADVQKLMLIAAGDQELLAQLAGGIGRIEERLDEGVKLSDESMARLADAVSRRAENSRRVRELALREMGPVAELTKRQVHRLQVRAVELVQEGALDRAMDELEEGLLLIAALLNEAPTDTSLRLQLGFLHKTISQVLTSAGRLDEAQSYIERAEDVFRFVKDDVSSDQKSALDVANTIHGLGNVDQERGDFASAIEKYKLATALYPDHMYAWHDIFAASFELARRGQVDLDTMRHALTQLRTTGEGSPGLGRQHIARLEEALHWVEIEQAKRQELDESKHEPLVRLAPERLAAVIAEADVRATAFNLNVDVVNERSKSVSVRRLEATVKTPNRDQVRFTWNVFYDSQSSSQREVMRGTGDPREIEIGPGSKVSLGIQFAGPEMDPLQLWTTGDYGFELGASVFESSAEAELSFGARFRATMGTYEGDQVKHWTSAQAGDWDRLDDPDRAVGIPLLIDKSSVGATLE